MRKDCEGTGNGTVSITLPGKRVVVGRRYGTRVTYTAGSNGVSVGGCLRFKLPGFNLTAFQGAPPVTCSDPDVGLRCTEHVPEVNGKSGSEFFIIDYMFVTIENTPLRPGESVSVEYGQSLLPIVAAPLCAMPWAVEVATDVDGTRAAPGSGFWLVRSAPVIDFVSDRPVKLELTIPSTTVAGEPFEAVVRAIDRYHNIVSDYTGTVRLLAGDGPGAALVQAHTFALEDRGVHAFTGVVLNQDGVARLAALDEGLGLFARSNATHTWLEEPPYQLYWGDTHAHSSVSADTAACESLVPRPAGVYNYARNRCDLHFCMVTDHSDSLVDEEWEETRRAARDWYEPGRFVTFSAFEVTHDPLRRDGDKNVYYLTDDQTFVNQGTTKDLYRELRARGNEAMVIPHLHNSTNWALHDPKLERVVEVYAHWGCGLSPDSAPPMIPGPGTRLRPSHYVNYALEQGVRIGFIASADHSWGHPGDDFWWPLSNYHGGLAGVYAGSLTRQGIWDGLWNRRCYGTTRARILLEFDIDSHPMGSEFRATSRTRHLRLDVHGTAPIKCAEIVKNGRVCYCQTGDGALDLELAHVDSRRERETDYYYAHVTQVDEEQAWSSPIWVQAMD